MLYIKVYHGPAALNTNKHILHTFKDGFAAGNGLSAVQQPCRNKRVDLAVSLGKYNAGQ